MPPLYFHMHKSWKTVILQNIWDQFDSKNSLKFFHKFGHFLCQQWEMSVFLLATSFGIPCYVFHISKISIYYYLSQKIIRFFWLYGSIISQVKYRKSVYIINCYTFPYIYHEKYVHPSPVIHKTTCSMTAGWKELVLIVIGKLMPDKIIMKW